MTALALALLTVFAITFLAEPTLGGGVSWDFANAVGFAALGGMLFQMPPTRHDAAATHRHEWLGYGVLILVAFHALWFLITDGAVHTYLKPGAPIYMWCGAVSLLALTVLVILARLPDRLRAFPSYSAFKLTHRLLGVLAVAGAAYHVIGSGFYLSHWAQAAALIFIAAAFSFGRAFWRNRAAPPPNAVRTYLILAAIGSLVFLLARNTQW